MTFGTMGRPAEATPPADEARGSGVRDRGMVTLEVALAIPMLTAVAVALVWCICLGAAYVSLGDTAFTVARRIARGEAAEVVVASVHEPDVAIDVLPGVGLVEVNVERTMRPPLGLLSGLSTTLRQQARMPLE